MPTTTAPRPPSPPLPPSTTAAPVRPVRPARRDRRALLVVIAVALAPALLLRELIGVFTAGAGSTVLDGSLLPGPAESAGGAGKLLVAVGWIVAFAAGTIVAAGGLRGRPVSPWAALRVAVRRLPWLLVMLLLIAIAAQGLMLFGSAALGPVGERASVFEFAAVLLLVLLPVLAVLATRLLVIPAIVLGDGAGNRLAHAHALASGRLVRTGASLLLGVVVLPLLATALTETIAMRLPVAAVPLEALGLAAAALLQSRTLADVYLRRRPAGQAGPEVSLDEVDRRLAELSAPAAPRPAAVAGAVALLLAPMLAGGAVVVGDPFGGPRATRTDVSWSGEVLATAWPQGGHPVVVTTFGPHWCLDDACGSVVSQSSDPLALGGPYAATAVTADGTVVAAGIRGREMPGVIKTDGDDAVQLQRCSAPWAPADAKPQPGTCEDGITRWHSGGDEDEAQLAVAAGADGAIVVATARPLLPAADGKARVQLAVTRCTTVHCTARSLKVLATLPLSLDLPDGRFAPAPLLRLTLDAQDRPTVLLRDPAGTTAHVAGCVHADCAEVRLSTTTAPADGAAPAVAVTGADGMPRLAEVPPPGVTGADPVALVAGNTLYGLGVEPVPADAGSLTGSLPGRRLVLWQCPPGGTGTGRRTVLAPIELEPRQAGLTVAADGRVFVTYADDGYRFTMLVTGAGKKAKGAYCRGFAG
ncbi:hypothetical protein ACFQY4_41470 [Catellatospora bangladeshensis]|uniref:hypothetical protein n=1 Tax=Catellatospora bangladeshensis TaxID=310355 RepID=UPI001940BC7F|nr:hypothetical protein [Catellatospora bangladeshensis]